MRCKARNPRLIYAGVSRQTRRLEILRLAECFDSTPPYMTELQVWNDWFNSRSLLSNLQIYSHCYNAQTVLVLVISETDSLSAVNEVVSKGASRWMEINNLVHHFKKVKNRGDVTLVLFHILFLSLLNLKTREHIQEERVLLIFLSIFLYNTARFSNWVEQDIPFYTTVNIVLTNAAPQAPTNWRNTSGYISENSKCAAASEKRSFESLPQSWSVGDMSNMWQ